MKKFLPLSTPNLIGNEKKYLKNCIESSFVSTAGEFIPKLEKALQKKTHTKHVSLVNSGTSALHLALIAAGVKPNDLVITSDYSFIATPNSIRYCHAEPVLVDVKNDSFNLDFSLVREFLKFKCNKKNKDFYHKKSNRRIAAILPVMALGNIVDPEELGALKSDFKIPIILDAAAGLGSKTKSSELGAFDFDYATMSFNANKIITTGAGGAVFTKSSHKDNEIKHLAATARKHPEYYHDEIGYNYRMPNINAALGLAQIEKLEKFVEKKQKIFNMYKQSLSSKHFVFFNEPENHLSCKWLSGMRIEGWSKRKIHDFIDYLNKNNIGASLFWQPISKQNQFKKSIQFLNGASKKISDRFIVLPSSTDMKYDDVKYTINKVLQYK